MFDLPPELVEEILYRVPAISLKRLQSTCKRWNALFKDQRFIEKHFRKASKQPRVLMLKECRLFSTSVDLNIVPPSIEFEDALDLKDPQYKYISKQVDISEVFHCDGLLLCITNGNRPVVWNPCLRKTRWIHHKNGTMWWRRKNGCDRVCRFALGYENNQSCRGYKILMFWGCDVRDGDQVDGFEIYELSSNSWRVVNAPNCLRLRYHGVTLKGNTYWASNGNQDEDEYIVSFDFTRERFRRLCFPSSQNPGCMVLSVVREEKLSALQWTWSMNSSKIQIWVTKEIDTTEAELSWSKFFAVDLHTHDNSFRVFTCLLIDEKKKVALCCNSGYGAHVNALYTIGEEDEYYTKISVPGAQWPFIFSYVPSLVKNSARY